MAKKVYKNKLQKDEEAKKEARRKQMEGKKRTLGPSRMERLFTEMSKMSEQEMKDRLEEIAARKEAISKETLGRSEKEGQEERIDILMAEYEKLDREEKRLKVFPEVKEQAIKIMAYRDKIIKRKAENHKKAKTELAEAKKQAGRIKAIDGELKKLEQYSKDFSKKADITDEDRKENLENAKRWNELLKEKNELSSKESQEKIQNRLKEAKENLAKYENGTSREDLMINKCNMAWKLLVAGKSWDEISLTSVERIQEEAKRTEQETPAQETPVQETPAQETPEQETPEQENNLPEKVERFAEKHPRIAKIPFFGRMIEAVADRKINEAERLQQIRESLENPEPSTPPKEEAGENPEKQEPIVNKEPEKAEPEKKKTERDLFIEYLREAVNNGHTEQGKYATRTQTQEKTPVEESKKEVDEGREPGED